MAKGEKKNNNRALDLQMLSSSQRWGRPSDPQSGLAGSGYLGMAEQDLNTARSQDALLRQNILDRYGNANNFLPEGIKTGSNGWFNLPGMEGGGGRVNFDSTGDFARARGGYERMADTGGREDFESAIGSYENFIKTGGLTGTDLDNIRYRATSQIPAIYGNLKNNMARRANVQGGYSPGFDAQNAELSRLAGREAYNASRIAEGEITDRTMQGKMFGTQGMAGIGELMSGNRLAGLGGLTGIGGAALQADIENARLADAQSGRGLDAQLRMMDLYQRGGLASSEGLSRLYATAPAATQAMYENYLAGLGGLDASMLGSMGLRVGNNQGGSDWWKNAIGMGMGLLGGYLGGRQNRTNSISQYNPYGLRIQDFTGRNEEFGT